MCTCSSQTSGKPHLRHQELAVYISQFLALVTLLVHNTYLSAALHVQHKAILRLERLSHLFHEVCCLHCCLNKELSTLCLVQPDL